MFASHASDMYAVGGRQNVWKANYTNRGRDQSRLDKSIFPLDLSEKAIF